MLKQTLKNAVLDLQNSLADNQQFGKVSNEPTEKEISKEFHN